MRPMLACLLLTLALPASAQIYKYTDANGHTVFTNQPPEGGKVETVDLPPTNTVEAQKPVATPPAEPEKKVSAAYEQLSLVLPSDEALRANNGSFTLDVRIKPRLQPGHSLRLVMDGKPYGSPANVPHLQVTNASRGEHSVSVQVLEGEKVVQQSDTQTFTLQRVDTNSPAMRPKPTPRT